MTSYTFIFNFIEKCLIAIIITMKIIKKFYEWITLNTMEFEINVIDHNFHFLQQQQSKWKFFSFSKQSGKKETSCVLL